jgi:hypothetical protein
MKGNGSKAMSKETTTTNQVGDVAKWGEKPAMPYLSNVPSTEAIYKVSQHSKLPAVVTGHLS